MRKSAVLFIVVLGLLMVLGIVMMQSLFVIQRIASVSEIAGEVYVKATADTDFRAITEDVNVLAGYMVRTGPTGAVTLNWVDGSRVRLGPETSITVRKCSFNTSSKDSTSLFDLDVGRIWVRVLSALGGNTKFEVRTPTATAGVRGTIFYVEVDESGATSVSVHEGEVEVSGQSGSASVVSGQQAVVTGSGASLTQDDALAAWSEQTGITGPRLDLDGGAQMAISPEESAVTVAGVSEPGATVTINGTEVELDRRSRFEAEVPADETGEGMIVVSATDMRGVQTVRAITVIPSR